MKYIALNDTIIEKYLSYITKYLSQIIYYPNNPPVKATNPILINNPSTDVGIGLIVSTTVSSNIISLIPESITFLLSL